MNQLTKLLVIYLTMPTSDFYITKLIAGSKNPTLEPLNSSNIAVGSFNLLGTDTAIRITTLQVVGISNVQIAKTNSQPEITVNGDQVSFVAVRPNTEAPPAGIPTNLTVSCQLVLRANGADSPPVPITITVAEGTLHGVFNATGDETQPGTVRVVFTSVSVQAEATPANIQFDLSQVQSFLEPQLAAYLTQPSTLTTLIAELNSQLTDSGLLSSLSQGATSAAQSALQKIIPPGL